MRRKWITKESALRRVDPRGYEIIYRSPQAMPMIPMVHVHDSRSPAVAITTTFSPNTLEGFKVWTGEIEEGVRIVRGSAKQT
jgi:hypothetical protein